MPNNIVFNNVADQMLTQIYAQNAGSPKALQADTDGNLLIVGTVTALTTPSFSETNVSLATITTVTVTALTETTAGVNMYSFYVKNDASADTATFTAWLQIAPVDGETYYVNDASTAVSIGGQSAAVLIAQKFLKFTRLLVQGSAETASAIIYYNGQT